MLHCWTLHFILLFKTIEKRKNFFSLCGQRSRSNNISKGDYFEIIKIIILLNQLKIKTYLHAVIDCNMRHVITNGFYHYGRDYNSYGDRRFPFKVMRPLISSGILFQRPNMKNFMYLKNFCTYAL